MEPIPRPQGPIPRAGAERVRRTEMRGQDRRSGPPERRLVLTAVGGLLFASCFSASFLAAFHEPRPHQVPVALVAPASEIHQLKATLQAGLPGGFSARSYPSRATARAAVLDRAVDGAFLAGRRPELLVASAGGAATVQLLTQTFEQVASSTGQQMQVADVAPLPAGNSDGLSAFFLVLSVLLPSLAVGVVSSFASKGTHVGLQVGALVGAAAAIGAVTVWVADRLTGALPGHYLALVGIAALFSLAISGPTAAFVRIAPPAAALGVVISVMIGVPATGGPVGLTIFLPTVYRVLGRDFHPRSPSRR
jgi:hypothetical protein